MLSDQIKGNTDVLMVSETKTDNGFLNGILLINGFSTTYKLDRNSNSARLIPAGNDARRRSGVFIFNFEHISHLVLVFLWLTLNR